MPCVNPPLVDLRGAQERQADRGVDVGEESDHAGQHGAQVCAPLVGDRDAVADEVLAGAAGPAQGRGLGPVGGQRSQAGAVGAQGVGQDVGVDRDRVVVAGPVQAGGDVAGRVDGQRDTGGVAGAGGAGRLHVSLLAASPSGEAPSSGAGVRLPVRSLIALDGLSPGDGPRIPGVRWAPQISQWTSPSSEQGDDPAAPRAHRQPDHDHRHQDGGPVSELASESWARRPAERRPSGSEGGW
jgi:hypothetical protein